jgi:hypothetical protein
LVLGCLLDPAVTSSVLLRYMIHSRYLAI